MIVARATLVLLAAARAAAAQPAPVEPPAPGEQPAPVARPLDVAELLYYEGNPSAAAAIFQQRFLDGGSVKNGIRAVRAWKEAGRYARARVLLASVAPKARVDPELEPHVIELEKKLARLTVLASLGGDTLARDAIVKLDGQLPERLDDRLVLDVGEHVVTIEQPLCERFVWRGLALPDEPVRIEVELQCAREGTFHLTLVGTLRDRTRSVFIDGKRYDVGTAADVAELEVKLAPGTHDLKIENHGRLVVAEPIEIEPNRTVSRRVRYPWRAQALQFGVRAATVVAGGREAQLAAIGLGAGMDGRWAAIFLDLGVAAAREGRGTWGGFEFAFHLFRRPHWFSRLGGTLVTLDFDPLAIRAELHGRPIEGTTHTRTTYSVGGLPVRLTAEWVPVQLQLTAWPLAYAGTTTSDGTAEGGPASFGFATTLTLGWHL